MCSAYVAFIRSVFLYCFPIFCNVPSYLLTCIARVERRVFRIIGDDAKNFERLAEAAENVCQRLFNEVVQNMQRPLRVHCL